MRPDRPSTTSDMVALVRAIASQGASSVRGFSDPVARDLLPPGSAAFADRLGRAQRGPAGPLIREGLRVATLGLLDMIPLRTAAIDEALETALALPEPPRQLVILGAGLDGRAHRMRSLADVTAFEVDHPATQAGKRERAARLPLCARALHYVAVDFERQTVGPALAAAGHRADAPTFWIWEGVIMYLTTAALRTTLAEVQARSAPKSRLAATYLAPARALKLLGVIVNAFGEPFLPPRTPETLRAELVAAGFAVLEDAGAREWSVRYGAPRVLGLVASERLVVAESR